MNRAFQAAAGSRDHPARVPPYGPPQLGFMALRSEQGPEEAPADEAGGSSLDMPFATSTWRQTE